MTESTQVSNEEWNQLLAGLSLQTIHLVDVSAKSERPVVTPGTTRFDVRVDLTGPLLDAGEPAAFAADLTVRAAAVDSSCEPAMTIGVVEIRVRAVYRAAEPVTPRAATAYVERNAIVQLYPYARVYVAGITSTFGWPAYTLPVVIPPMVERPADVPASGTAGAGEA